jgi:hypothetical protein
MHTAVSISGTKIQIYNGETEIQQNSFNLDADTLEILILDSSRKTDSKSGSPQKRPQRVVLKLIIMVPLHPVSPTTSTSLAIMIPDPVSCIFSTTGRN